MPDDAERTDGGWLLQPLGPNDVRIHVAVGDGVELSDEARAALDTFVDELHTSEVEGFGVFPTCPSFKQCGAYSCTLGKCAPLDREGNCFVNEACVIQALM